jgi:P-type Mg2+ transporter
LRDGGPRSIPADEVVTRDVIEPRAGDLVPADGVLLSARDLHVNEALLTGEPFPVEKRPGVCDASEPADVFNALFSGTSVINGEGRMLAVATGAGTRFGTIAARLSSEPAPTAFERGIHGLALLILRLTLFLVLFVVLVNLVFGRPIIDTFLFAVALAVGLTPELLPMITTVTLSRGALLLARKRAIVKRLAAIHDLGGMDVLCTDETGTLTEAKITLAGHPDVDGFENEQVLTLAAVNSVFGGGIRSPLDDAIVSHGAGIDLSAWRKIDEIPFDFERRCVSVLVENEGRRVLILKGAGESVIDKCNHSGITANHTAPITAQSRTELVRREEDYAAQGYRVVAIAWNETAANTMDKSDEADLVFADFCLFLDPPKEMAAGALARLRTISVRVKIVSGDHPSVVQHLAAALGLKSRELMTGSEIAGLTDAALSARLEDTDFFARVSPDQKTRIIRALQLRGHTVGFIGDGVNDAPAIHAADVGLSVDGATDVARSAADIILLSPDLRIIADGIEEGRRTFANILKYVRMGTSSNFGNMLSMALASVILPFLPLMPVQVLLNNLLYDFSEIGIPFDRVDRADLAWPRA